MVDWNQVRALAGAQWRLDLRHPKTGAARSSRVLLTAVSYGLSSLLLAFSLQGQAGDVATVLFVGLSFALVLAAFAVVGTYDDLMGRPKDHAWALTLPASEATHYVARLVNVGLTIGVMGISTAIPLAALVGMARGVGDGLAVAAILLGTMAAVTLVALGVIWALTLALSHRVLKPVMNVARTALVGSLVVGYQWVGTQSALRADVPWWPPQWVVEGVWLAEGVNASTLGLVAIGLALALAFGVVFPRRYFALLTRMAEGEGRDDSPRHARVAPNAVERLVVRSSAGQAAFGLTVAALRSDRLVQGRVWPAALLALVFAVFGWWTDGLGNLFVYGAEAVLSNPAVQMHLSILVVLLFSAQTIVQAVQFSAHDAAAWLFDTLPTRSGRTLQVGAQAALVFRVLLPLHVVLALLMATTMPPVHAALHAGFWLGACALVTRVQALLHRAPPFSRRSDRFSFAERFGPLLLSIPAALALLLIQNVAFTSVPNAALALLGFAALHHALGRLPGLGRRRSAPTWSPAPVEASVPA